MIFKSPKYILFLLYIFDSLGKVEIKDDSDTGTADDESSKDHT